MTRQPETGQSAQQSMEFVREVLGNILRTAERIPADSVLGSRQSGVDSFEILAGHLENNPRDLAELVVEFSADIQIYLDKLGDRISVNRGTSFRDIHDEAPWRSALKPEIAILLQADRALKSIGGLAGLCVDFKHAKTLCLDVLGQNKGGMSPNDSTGSANKLSDLNSINPGPLRDIARKYEPLG
jgi:hypothetical protein